MTRILALIGAFSVLLVNDMAMAQIAPTPEPTKVDTPKNTTRATAGSPLRLCTGGAGNNYHRVGVALKEALKGTVDVEVIETQGSWENLELLDQDSPRCDAVIAQEDAYALHQFERPDSSLNIDRMATLYPEHVHLLCNKAAKGDSIGDLDPRDTRILVNSYGSGSFITWRLFATLNKAYKSFRVVESGVDEGLLQLRNDRYPTCFFFVSGLGGRTLNTAHGTLGDRVRLMAVVDRALHRPVGREKRQIYAPSTITQKVYPRLLTGDLDTQSVDAALFLSPTWKTRHPLASAKLAQVLLPLLERLEKEFR